MKALLVIVSILASLVSTPCYAYLSTPEIESLTQKILFAESSGKSNSIGDGGRSRGVFQIIKPTWDALSKYPWSDALDAEKNYQVGAKLIHEIHENYGKHATPQKIAYTFNTGKYVKPGKPLPPWTKNHPNDTYRKIFNEGLA